MQILKSQGKIAVILEDFQIYQDIDPATRLGWADEEVARAWGEELEPRLQAEREAEIEAIRNTPPPEPPAPVVPYEVSPRQIRRALSIVGLREAVEGAVATADEEVKDAWFYSTAFYRDNPLVLNLAVALNKTEEELDNIFILASTL